MANARVRPAKKKGERSVTMVAWWENYRLLKTTGELQASETDGHSSAAAFGFRGVVPSVFWRVVPAQRRWSSRHSSV